MKHVIQCIAWCLTLCLTQQLSAQSTGIPYTGTYTAQIDKSHTIEKDKLGNVTKALNIVTGTGTNTIMGEVTTMSLVYFDISAGDNVIEFTETDSEGNSIFTTTKGSPGKNGGWVCYGTITGGTGKYKTATGGYKAIGSNDDNGSTWTGEGTLFYTSEADDKAAIKKVIAAETQAYINKDFDAMDNAYAIAPFTTNITNVPVGTVTMAQRYLNGKPPVRDQKMIDGMIKISDVVRSDWDIQLRGEVAWVIYHQKLNAMGARFSSVETRILEKLNGQWKIVYSSTFADHEAAVPLSSSSK